MTPGIRLEGDFAHDGRKLFGDLVLELHSGQCTCLLGSSGIGKSTLLRLIAGLETGGSFSGAITTTDHRPIQGRVAYMDQSDLLLPWLTAWQNVALGARLRREKPDRAKVDRLIRDVGLASHARKKPRQLSGGMRQRCALARTLMEDTPVVLLDEPFSALDPATRRQMQTLAGTMLRGRTVMLVTHDMGEALRMGDRIYAMSGSGLQSYDLAPCATTRQLDDPAVMEVQARIFSVLNA